MNLLRVSVSGAVFIFAVVIIRAAAINHLPKKTFLVLWEAILLRLMLPFEIPSMFRAYTLMNRRISAFSYLEAEIDSITSAILQEPVAAVWGTEQLPANGPSVSVWFLIWCAGMVLFAAFFAVSYLRCRIEFRAALPVSNAYAEQWLKERPLKRQISIRQSDRILAPLVYGIFRPVILMPKKTDWENVNQLQYIFTHEYVHICRFDAFTKLIAALVLCIHWFNPFVWGMYILFNRDLELACDERVIRQFGEQSKSDYSRMLISMEAKKSGLPPLYSSFSKNVMEERITAIMYTKRPTFVRRLMSACLIVFALVSLFSVSAIASSDGSSNGYMTSVVRNLQTNAKAGSMSIIHESAEILYYEDGEPYIHDILTNHTDQTIVETQYCMLAYHKNGSPLKLHWNFLDSSAESSFENIIRSKENILANETEEYSGGWSLYAGEKAKDGPKSRNFEGNQAAYILFCLKQVVFEDGTVWNNPNYENWFQTYAGKEKSIDDLQNYYPYEYKIE